MARVIVLTHDEFYHRPSGTRFTRAAVDRVFVGVAEVDDATAREHFEGRAEFDVLYPAGPSPALAPRRRGRA